MTRPLRVLFLPIWLTRTLQGAFFANHHEGVAPLDAKPCCQEAALRLIGRCDGVCNGGSELQSILEAPDERYQDRNDRTND